VNKRKENINHSCDKTGVLMKCISKENCVIFRKKKIHISGEYLSDDLVLRN
jgi:hypothetical protein